MISFQKPLYVYAFDAVDASISNFFTILSISAVELNWGKANYTVYYRYQQRYQTIWHNLCTIINKALECFVWYMHL